MVHTPSQTHIFNGPAPYRVSHFYVLVPIWLVAEAYRKWSILGLACYSPATASEPLTMMSNQLRSFLEVIGRGTPALSSYTLLRIPPTWRNIPETQSLPLLIHLSPNQTAGLTVCIVGGFSTVSDCFLLDCSLAVACHFESSSRVAVQEYLALHQLPHVYFLAQVQETLFLCQPACLILTRYTDHTARPYSSVV